MRVSVLIPTLGRDTLGEAIASAEAQGAEVVVERDSDRTGQSATLNRAFQRSTGEYVTVLHDDDYYVRSDALDLMRRTLDEHPEAAAVYSLPQYVDADGVAIPTPDTLRSWALDHPVVCGMTEGFLVHGIGLLYRRRWWERAGGWDESLPCCEEWDFHLRLLSLGAVFVSRPEVTVAYRRHGGQKSGRHAPLARRSARRKAVRQRIRTRYGL